MRVLVCGGRDFQDVDFMMEHLMGFHGAYPFSCVITGKARGADTIAECWAEEFGIPVESYPVHKGDWQQHGKRAGIIRNQEMLDQSHPDLVMAFPGGNGTAHMVKIARKGKVDVWQSNPIWFNSGTPLQAMLSNFALGYPFHDEDGVVWETVEHYYQASKFLDESHRGKIQLAKTPSEAKKLGRRRKDLIREDWECPPWEEFGGYKEVAMRKALAWKFPEGSEQAQMLIDTEPDYLIELAPWGDRYWGCTELKFSSGLNRLGKLLMERRRELMNS